MADKLPPRTLRTSEDSPSYELPSHDSSLTAPAIRAPGRSPSTNRTPATSGVEVRLPGRRERLAPDDRLARPEVGRFGEEVVDGVRMECLASEAEHADPQTRLAHIVSACLAEGYVTSSELLTRVEEESDFATDVCVRKEGVDPETGGRYLEEISFEVANSQTRENLEEVRIPKLVRCGVRRIFVVLVPEGDVLEWSIRDGEWVALAGEDKIRDRVFVQPLEVKAILDATQVDQLVSKAQLTKREPHLMREIKKREDRARARGEARGEALGEAKGLGEAILRAFQAHGITLDAENRQAIRDCRDTALLRRWLGKALVAESAAEILADLEKG